MRSETAKKILFETSEETKEKVRETANRLVMENKLISMTDYSLEICKEDFNNGEYPKFNLKDKIWKYATFLKQPPKLGMFVPCDENDVPLNLCDCNSECGYCSELEQYQEAKDRVSFEGFEIIGQSEGFCEIELKNGDFWMTFLEGEINVTNQFNQEYSVHVIEDLIQEDLTLTASAIKQFEL